MKKLFTICAALFAFALIGCEDPSEEMFTQVEEQSIEIVEGDNVQTANKTWDAETE